MGDESRFLQKTRNSRRRKRKLKGSCKMSDVTAQTSKTDENPNAALEKNAKEIFKMQEIAEQLQNELSCMTKGSEEHKQIADMPQESLRPVNLALVGVRVSLGIMAMLFYHKKLMRVLLTRSGRKAPVEEWISKEEYETKLSGQTLQQSGPIIKN